MYVDYWLSILSLSADSAQFYNGLSARTKYASDIISQTYRNAITITVINTQIEEKQPALILQGECRSTRKPKAAMLSSPHEETSAPSASSPSQTPSCFHHVTDGEPGTARFPMGLDTPKLVTYKLTWV
jgi:hypothetical protein